MKTSFFFAALLLAGGAFLFTGCGEPKTPKTLTIIPLDYLIQQELGDQLEVMLADTSAIKDQEGLRKLSGRYLTAVEKNNQTSNAIPELDIITYIPPNPPTPPLPPPPPPPCVGITGKGCYAIEGTCFLVGIETNLEDIKVLDADGNVIAGFRETEVVRLKSNDWKLCELSLMEGYSVDNARTVRVAFEGSFIDIPLKYGK